MPRVYNQFAGGSVDRIAALSDGVFAIALTLIVLEIRVPELAQVRTEADLLHALARLAPQFLMYAMSFMTAGIFWVGQQTQLNHLKHADRDLTWLYIAFLAFVAVIPFSTELLARYITLRTALVVYWLNILALGVSLLASWVYAKRHDLLREEVTPEVKAAVWRRIWLAQGLYALGAALCLINTYWSIGFIALVQLNYAVAPRVPILRDL
jgi:uncharacterized membrane protein